MRRRLTAMTILALTVTVLLSVNATARPIEIIIQKPTAVVNGNALAFEDFTHNGHTYTNVLRSPDVEYFINLKKRFKMEFDPEPSLRRYFESAPVVRGEISTVIGVAINAEGKVIELFVMNSNAIPGFDEEAMRTVRASGSYPPPPKKIMAEDAVLRMAWTFSVYI